MELRTRMQRLDGWWRIWLVLVALVWAWSLYPIIDYKPSLPRSGIDAAIKQAGASLVRRGKCILTDRDSPAPYANPYAKQIGDEASGDAPADAKPIPNGVEVSFKTGESEMLDAFAWEVLCLRPGTDKAVVGAVREAYLSPDDRGAGADMALHAVKRVFVALGLTLLFYLAALVVRWIARGFTGKPKR